MQCIPYIWQSLCFAFVSRSVKLFSLDDLVRKDRISQNILHHARTCTMDDTRHSVYVKAVMATIVLIGYNNRNILSRAGKFDLVSNLNLIPKVNLWHKYIMVPFQLFSAHERVVYMTHNKMNFSYCLREVETSCGYVEATHFDVVSM